MPRIPSYPLIGSLSNDDLLVIDDVSQQYATKSVELQSLKGYFNTGQATTTYVDDKVVSGAGFNTNTGVLTLTRTDGVAVTQDLDGRYALTTDVFSGNYNDLTNKPTIPTDNSQLANGEGYTDNLGVVQSLTTTGNSGAATLTEGVLNIPQYSGGGGGGVTEITTTAPITGGTITTTGTIGITQASGSADGYLSSTDWNTFNSKSTFDGQFSSLSNTPTTIAGYGITDALQLGITSTTALAGDTTTITNTQATAIVTNSGKISFPGFGTTAGTALEGDTTTISAQQASDITVNNAKVGITTQQASDITTNNAKVGITTQQSADIVTNNSKVSMVLGTTAGTALEGNTVIPAEYTNADVDAHLNTNAAGNNEVLSWTGSDYDWVAQSGGGAGVTQITAGDGISINPAGGTGNVTITAGTSQASTWQTYYRKFTGSELKSAFNGNNTDKITLVSVPAGKVAVLGIELTTFLNFSTGTTDYADNGRSLAVYPDTTSGFQYATSISMGSLASIGSANPFGIKFKQVNTSYAQAAEPGSDVVLAAEAIAVNITAGDRDFILTFTYRIIDLS